MRYDLAKIDREQVSPFLALLDAVSFGNVVAPYLKRAYNISGQVVEGIGSLVHQGIKRAVGNRSTCWRGRSRELRKWSSIHGLRCSKLCWNGCPIGILLFVSYGLLMVNAQGNRGIHADLMAMFCSIVHANFQREPKPFDLEVGEVEARRLLGTWAEEVFRYPDVRNYISFLPRFSLLPLKRLTP